MEAIVSGKMPESVYIKEIKHKMMAYVNEHSDGFLKTMCLSHFSNSGKFFRSRVLLRLGDFYHIDVKKLIPFAVACEFLHEASLVHDDYQDGDLFRRGAPTTWSLYGGAQAINVGDFLLMLSYMPLAELEEEPSLGLKLTRLHTICSTSLVKGQANELELNHLKLHHDEYLSLYLDCIKSKTSSLFKSIAQGVALLANLDLEHTKRLGEIYTNLGVIFQMQDDILDLYCDKKRDQQGSDIKEGKVSLLVALFLKVYGEDEISKTVKDILLKDREQTTCEDILLVKSIFEKHKVLEMSLKTLKERIFSLLEEVKSFKDHKLETQISKDISDLLKPIQSILK